jgi:superfamily II DNA helicase RecQ
MASQLKFFVIPIRELEAVEAEVNRFLRSVRVVHLQREFVPQGDNSFWSLAVEYLADGASGPRRRARIDYKEVLSPEAFGIFATLREWRKAKAAREAVPVYTIFTNEQLAEIAKKQATTKTGLQAIDGIGEARVKKYGDEVARLVADRCRKSEESE